MSGYLKYTRIILHTWDPEIKTNSFYSFRFLWPCIVGILWSDRENQQDATIRCLFLTNSQHVRASLCPSSGDQDVCYCMCCAALLLLDVVGSGCGALRCGVWALWRLLFDLHSAHTLQGNAHNRYQPHPAEAAQHNTCSNTRLGLRKMGIMVPETCWEIVKNKHLTVASCWFSLSPHNSFYR